MFVYFMLPENKIEKSFMMDIESQLRIISQNADKFLGKETLREKLAQGKRLRIKLGVDPTRPDYHLQ